MNTSKQVNVMIGFLFVSFVVFGLYILTEPARQSAARDEQEVTHARRGAELFVNNCRNCHGLEGEGHVGPPLAMESFLVLGEDNRFGAPPTPIGEADRVEEFIFNTIECGRVGTFMPPWGEEHGGPLSDTQINYLVTLITKGRWDLVQEIGHHHDEESGMGPEQILVQDPAALSVTQNVCGQYASDFAGEIRGRTPLAAGGGGGAPPPQQTPGGGQQDPVQQGEQLAQSQGCLSCHSTGTDAKVGPGWGGLFGKTETLEGGQTVKVDEDYLRESILRPEAKVVQGFNPVMPSYEGRLDDEQLNALIEYIKSLQ